MRTKMSGSLAHSLRRAEKLFGAADREELTPAARWLRDNARALYALAREEGPDLRGREYDRLRALCEDMARLAAGPIREAALCRAIRAAEEELTVRALRALPDMLRRQLLRRLDSLLPGVTAEYREWLQGGRLAAAPLTPIAAERARTLLTQSGRAADVRALEGRMRAQGIAPRAFALSYSSRTSVPAPSPTTSPSRPASYGAGDAPGASFLSDVA